MQIETNEQQAKLTKIDLRPQILKLKDKLKAKYKAHSLELDLTRANVVKVQMSQQKTYSEVCSACERKFP